MVDNKIKKGRGGKPDKKNENNKMMSALAKPEVADLIGQRLKTYYNSVAEQPVPDRFIDLLNRHEAATEPKKSDREY